MQIRRLKLRNFRNYESCDTELKEGLNLITGMNAQGKTNLLESLVYVSLTRSHRISNDRKLIKEGCEFADIRVRCLDRSIERNLEAVIYPKGKTLMIEKEPVKRSSQFIGVLNVILFAPDDLYIFNDAPRERRRLMNQEITKISPEYLLSLNRYSNLLHSRNLLLKERNVDRLFLETLSEQMAAEEERIICERYQFCTGVNTYIGRIYEELSGDKDSDVKVSYKCCIDPQTASKDTLFEMHKESGEKDIENRMTSCGVHREDLIFTMNGQNVVNFASQGQKRMVMLSFKMALRNYIFAKTKREPVLLLDDVLSELDQDKQRRLLHMIKSCEQCIITATEVPLLSDKAINEMRIEYGTILHKEEKHE